MVVRRDRLRHKETGGGDPQPVFWNRKRRAATVLLGVDLLGETGNFAGSRFLVQHPFLGRFVDRGLGRVELLRGIVAVFGHSQTDLLDNGFNPGLNRFVPQAPTLVLARALQC
jgi:hypothetical protein